MCKAASFVATRDKVYFSVSGDSHETIIEENKINMDGVCGTNGVRVELSPSGDMSLDGTWTYKLDQDTKPEWYNPVDVEARCRAALPDWWKCRIVDGSGYLYLSCTQITNVPKHLQGKVINSNRRRTVYVQR